MSNIVRPNLYMACLLVILFFFACISPEENTPSEVVEDFLEKIQFLSQPIYANRAEIGPEEIAEYDKIRREIPRLFENERKGQTIMMGFLFGTFDSFKIISDGTRNGEAVVEAEIEGLKFLGIAPESEETLVHHVKFRLAKSGRRWYISDLLPSNEE